ncbi:unnamed protein product [Hyaloperonospora brassicae]|uniref:Uncharacterized protein n=1 Tax=Hyaloperonospora brassicae TaxID=162125 RepID=A0AAV0T9J9_HYABA|nr:unnamed protein product [Hyaloperonospora brassicae]
MPTPSTRSDAVQLWAAVRGFSDAQLRCVETCIDEYYCSGCSHSQLVSSSSSVAASEAPPRTTINNFIELQLDDRVQSVHVDDFVHVFLSFLHEQIRLHTDARIQDNATKASVSDAKSNTITSQEDSNTATFDPHSQTFEDEFPQLTPVRVAPKPTKRRITTTLLTCQEPTIVARSVPVPIAFPRVETSESTARSSIWAKRSLLEKRMATLSSTAAFSTEETKRVAQKPQTAWATTVPESATAAHEAANAIPKAVRTTQVRKMEKNAKIVRDPGCLSQKKARADTPQCQLVEVTQINCSLEQATTKKKATLVSTKQTQQVTCQSPTAQPAAITNAKADVLLSNLAVNTQAAKLYGFLIRRRFVKKTCTELQTLICLLYRADCTACYRNKLQEQQDGESAWMPGCVEPSEFCWRVYCLDFAAFVFQEIEGVIVHLGDDLLALFKHSLCSAERARSNKLLERLDRASRRREAFRVAESARIGCRLPVEMKASAVHDFTIPFNEEIDSRLHYRTPAESQLYTNREKVRDLFLSLLRHFQQNQHSLAGIKNAGVAVDTSVAARKLLIELSPENKWWFAKFFVQELTQVGSNPFGESDKDLLLKIMEDKLVVKNPDRLRKLHRRFSSQKMSTKSFQSQMQDSHRASNVSSHRNVCANGKDSNDMRRRNRSDVRPGTNEVEADKSSTSVLYSMRRFFTDNQLFFFHFLHSCDSYEFSELVKRQLERQFHVHGAASAAVVDARKGFTEAVLKLKVVAKFLGYLHFSPQWQVTSSVCQVPAQSTALKAIEREGIETLEVSRGSNFDVKKLLEKSILQASIAKCIPWLCDYLSMLSLDRLSLGTIYFKQLVVLMRLLYRSPLVDSLGETGLYIALQIERVFQVLKVDDHREDLRSLQLLPSKQMSKILASSVGQTLSKKSEGGAGEDCLPFLYSQVFLRSCVSELDDLRGFIQTQAQEPQRRIKQVGSVGQSAAGQMHAPIRKLRPLQVVIGDDDSVDTNLSLFSDKLADAHTESQTRIQQTDEHDKLSEALFKVHPKLRAVVEFVVGTSATDVCEHVIAHVVTPLADALVDLCASESSLLNVKKDVAASATFGEHSAFVVRASFYKLLMSKTHHEANLVGSTALQEALRLGEERVHGAISACMPPSSHPTLVKSIVTITLQRTRSSLTEVVPKNAQAEFVKRVSWRHKTLLKDLGLTPRTTDANLSFSTPPVQPCASAKTQRKKVLPEGVQQYQELRRHVALISKSASHDGSKMASLPEYESRVVVLSVSLSQFLILLNDCVGYGDSTRDPGPTMSISALVMWDVIWRSLTSCLAFLEMSLTVLDACKLASARDDRAVVVENSFVDFAAKFALLLKVVARFAKQSPRRATIASRLQPMLASVTERVEQLLRSDKVLKRTAFRARFEIAAQLREVVSCFTH